MKRIFAGVLATLTALLLAATLAPAQAAAPADKSYDGTATVERAAQAKPMRYVGSKFERKRPGWRFYGHIGPNQSYKLSKVLIREGHCKRSAAGLRCWGFKGNVYKTVKTNRVGNYSARVDVPVDCKWHWFNVAVPARGDYAFSRSKTVIQLKKCRS